MEATISSRFIDSIWDYSKQDFPEDVIKEVKLCLLDYIGCTFIGASLLDKNSDAVLRKNHSNRGISSIIGTDKKSDSYTAALLSGIHGHYLELDDGSRSGMIHLGASVFSAMISVAQANDLGSDDFIRGVLVSYEAINRLASAIQPSHKLKGFHATGTCGTIGISLGIASALNYKKDLWNSVLAAAGTSAAGLLEIQEDHSEMKPYNVGHCAAAAIEAACFGASELLGPNDILGGERGFIRVYADDFKEDLLYKTDQNDHEIKKIYRKPYAACRHCHAAIEALLHICNENHIDEKEIQTIEVQTYSLAVKGHDYTDISNAGSAKLSMPYSLAAAVHYGSVDYQQYDKDCIEEIRKSGLMNKVVVKEDPKLSALVPKKRAAAVTVYTNDKLYSCQVDYPLGEPENPIADKDLEKKYLSLMAASGKDTEYGIRLMKKIYNIDKDLNGFLEMI